MEVRRPRRPVATAVGLLAAALLASSCGARQPARPGAASGRIVATSRARLGPAPWSLTDLDFLSEQQGFVVAERCGPLPTDCQAGFGSTTDGGTTFHWTRLGQGFPAAVQFLDPQRGWVLIGRPGQPQRLLGTSDGGRRWTRLAAGPFAVAPHFLTPAFGYAVAAKDGAAGEVSASMLELTADGGRTWRPVSTGGYTPADADFLDPEHGYVAGWRCTAAQSAGGASCQGAILGTSDGGLSWHLLQAVGTSDVGNTGTFALDFLSRTTGFAALPNLQGCTMGGCLPGLEATGDGGKTWRTLQPAYRWGAAIQAGWPSGPFFTSPLLGWLGLSPGAGPGAGGVLVTTDGGKSFRQYFARQFTPGSLDPVGSMAYAIAQPLPSGSGGSALVRISLQGVLQQVWPSRVPNGGFGADQGGVLSGLGLPQDARALLVSPDGGRTWSIRGDLPGGPPWLVSFPDSLHGYLLAESPSGGALLYETEDAGRRWRPAGRVLAQEPGYARFFAGGTAVAVDVRETSGTVWRSTDGGRTWRAYGSLPSGYAWALAFSSAERGYAYVERGGSAVLYGTRDGGRHWLPVLRPSRIPEQASPGAEMAIDRSGFGVLQRYAGTGQLLLTRDGGRTWYALNLGQAAAPSAIAVAGKAVALIQTTSGLLRTSDGGRSWAYLQ